MASTASPPPRFAFCRPSYKMAEGVRTEVTYTVECAVGRLVALFPGSTVVEAGSVVLVLGSSPTAEYLDDEGLAAAAGTMTVLCRLAVEN